MVHSKSVVISASVTAFAVITSITIYRWCCKKKSFYSRLKEKRFLYSLHNVKLQESSIIGDLRRGQQQFTLSLTFQEDIIHLQINDPLTPRFVIKDVAIHNPQLLTTEGIEITTIADHLHIRYKSLKLKIDLTNFAINIYKHDDLLLKVTSLIIEEQEPQVAISTDFLFANSFRLYGLPQHASPISLAPTNNKPYKLYNIDRFGYSAENPHESLYGAVPVIYGYGSKHTTGLLWLNSSETLVDVENDPGGVGTRIFSESGVVDFFVLCGGTLRECVRQNSQLTGVAPLPPLFSLGYHQSRFSYMSQEEVVEVSNKFDEHDLPLDCLWLDIDYTDEKKYFTWNPTTYPNPAHLLKFLEDRKRKVVVIIDPHIKVDDDYFVYHEFLKGNYFITNPDKTIFTAKCWPGVCSWLDFLNPKAREFYADLHQDFTKFKNLHVWNDMNEPAVFESEENTIPKYVVHYDGWKHRDVHNLYGFYQTMATYEGLLKRPNLRPFILTRSHFAGSQRFAAIWTGDNVATWAHLKISVPMCITASLAGFSFCGADIGGFVKHPEDELLQRWYQLGCWLPFFRGHSNKNVPRREPYLYHKTVQNTIRDSLQLRYKHLLHWYTLFWQHTVTLEPVIRPLVYQYSNDGVVVDLDDEFLVGDSILVCPVTEPQGKHVEVYLPGEGLSLWYTISGWYERGGGWMTVPVDMESIPVFYRGGAIIPMVDRPVQSSAGLQHHPITLYIFCDRQQNSSGCLYIDDFESFDYVKKEYCYVRFDLENSTIRNVQIHENDFSPSLLVGSIKLFGYSGVTERINVTVNGVGVPNYAIVSHKGSLTEITGLNLKVHENFVISLGGEGNERRFFVN